MKKMSIKVHIHVTHRCHTGGCKTVEVRGTTIGEALKHLVDMHSGLKKELFDKKGNLQNYIEIYLNGASAYPDELAKPVKDGDEIQVVTFLAGG
jgi:molybdopterin converting factor small subunit